MHIHDIGRHAQGILTRSAESDLRIVAVAEVKEGKVYRATLEGPSRLGASTPESVIIKIADATTGTRPDARSPIANPAHDLLEEWAGLEFLQGSGTPRGLTPRLHGGITDPCMIVMEDFGTLPSVADILTSETGAERATDALRLRAVAQAHLQGATYGQEDRYLSRRRALGPTPAQRNWQTFGTLRATQGWTDIRTLARPLVEGLASIGQNCPDSLREDIDALANALADPGRRAFVQSDSCPENTLIEGDSAHLIDMERGGFHSLAMDIVFSRMGMPHCFWAGKVPSAVVRVIEQDYRSTLNSYHPELAEERRFGQQIVEACGYWLLGSGAWLLSPHRREDFTWGNSTWRRRVIHRLHSFADASAEFSHLEAMAESARESSWRLTKLWGEQDLGPFPPYAGSVIWIVPDKFCGVLRGGARVSVSAGFGCSMVVDRRDAAASDRAQGAAVRVVQRSGWVTDLSSSLFGSGSGSCCQRAGGRPPPWEPPARACDGLAQTDSMSENSPVKGTPDPMSWPKNSCAVAVVTAADASS